jgi:hypothetical protein
MSAHEEDFLGINIIDELHQEDYLYTVYITIRQDSPIDLYSSNINNLNIINYLFFNFNRNFYNNYIDEKEMSPEEIFTHNNIKITHFPCEIEENECPILGKKTDCITCCNHAFCQESLAKWLRKNKHCPLCRKIIVEINIPST